MTCQECQQAIIIYDLLDAHERELMEQHKATCVPCEKFWQETLYMNATINRTHQKIEASNPIALTDRIMTSVIRNQNRKASENWIQKLIFNGVTRLTLSGVSICLVVLFFIEIQSESFDQKSKGPVAGLQVILNSHDLRKNFSTSKKEKKPLISQCLNSDNTVDLVCLKSKMKF